jgi:hypothetical protein
MSFVSIADFIQENPWCPELHKFVPKAQLEVMEATKEVSTADDRISIEK